MAEIRSFIPEEMVKQILLRLPIKSLMRLKVVSKLWRSIIRDPSFAAAYCLRFRGLLLSQPSFARFSPTKDFFYVSLDSGHISHHLTVVHGGERSLAYTGIVNGLVCFYYGDYSCLYNIATRESMELPRSEYGHDAASYHLGFDPVSKLYKVLKICPVYEEDGYEPQDLSESFWLRSLDYSEILTVGIDTSWRHIDPVPMEILRRGVCIDGALYWDEDMHEIMGGVDDHLIAFHLAREKFELVPLPVTESKNMYSVPYYAPRLFAIAAGTIEVKIHSHGDDGVWRLEHELYLQPETEEPEEPEEPEDLEFSVVAVLPDGKVVQFEDDETLYFPTPFYLYDPVEKKSRKIVMRISPTTGPHSKLLFEKGVWGRLSYHEENIIALNCLGNKINHHD